LHDTITAPWSRFAGRSWYRTDVAALKLARGAAAVAALGIAIVAVFARLDTLVAALGIANARLAGNAFEGRVLNRAGGIAAVAVNRVSVVANLARANFAVAADDVACTFPGLGARPVLLDLADAVAAVAGEHVAIVALLDAALIVDAVAAALGNFDFAARSAGAVANE
jgi:hypothetical protein